MESEPQVVVRRQLHADRRWRTINHASFIPALGLLALVVVLGAATSIQSGQLLDNSPILIALALFLGLAALVYWNFAKNAAVHVRRSELQVADLEQGKCLAQWRDPKSGDPVFIGRVGLVLGGEFTPWRSGLRLTKVEHDANQPALRFVFQRQTKGEFEEQIIAAPLPVDACDVAGKVVGELQRAIEDDDWDFKGAV